MRKQNLSKNLHGISTSVTQAKKIDIKESS